MTPDGTFSSRTAKRLPVGGRADKELLARGIGTPWDRQCEAPRGRPRLGVAGPIPVTLPATTATQQPDTVDVPPAADKVPAAEHTEVEGTPKQPSREIQSHGGAAADESAQATSTEIETLAAAPAGDIALGAPATSSDAMVVDKRTQEMRRLSNDWRESVAAESDAKRQKGDENALISAVTDGLH